MANKCDKCDKCVDSNTDYWKRPCFICVFGDKFIPNTPQNNALKGRWK